MKQIFAFAILLCLSTVFFSCEDNDNSGKISELEDKINGLTNNVDSLTTNVGALKSVIALQDAYNKHKQIASATQQNTDGNWLILFSDNTNVNLPKNAVKSVTENKTTGEYTIVLFDDRTLIFNRVEIVHPTGIVTITPEIVYLKNMEVSIEFRVNPSNAVFNYDVTSENCQIAIDEAEKIATYSSYATPPKDFRLSRIEPSVGADGEAKAGQYKAYIRDNGGADAYKYATALVLSVANDEGDTVRLSSPAIPVERKMDTGLPIVIINTANKAAVKDKEIWISAEMKIDGVGRFDDYAGTTGVRGRGNLTWRLDKKPYALKLDSKSKILGMPSHKRWVLLANHLDRTLMRNHIAFEVARRTGLEWTPRGQFVELVFNGAHQGTYYLCEHIKVDKNRVNIEEMKATDIEGDDVTGGYLLEIDSYYDEVNKFCSAIDSLPVMFQSPDEEVLQPAQFEYMRNYIDSLENILHDKNFATTRDYLTMIDTASFIDWWLVHEIMGNIEPNTPKSCYFHKDRLGLMKAGPVWDFDISANGSVDSFYDNNAFWIKQLLKDPDFVRTVKKRWARFKPAFEEVIAIIAETGVYIERSAILNERMWPKIPSDNSDSHMAFGNAYGAVDRLQTYYTNRLIGLDRQIEAMR